MEVPCPSRVEEAGHGLLTWFLVPVRQPKWGGPESAWMCTPLPSTLNQCPHRTSPSNHCHSTSAVSSIECINSSSCPSSYRTLFHSILFHFRFLCTLVISMLYEYIRKSGGKIRKRDTISLQSDSVGIFSQQLAFLKLSP